MITKDLIYEGKVLTPDERRTFGTCVVCGVTHGTPCRGAIVHPERWLNSPVKVRLIPVAA